MVDDSEFFDVVAQGRRMTYIDSYPLEGMSRDGFEDKGYDLWKYTFRDTFDDIEDVGNFLDEE